MLRTINQNKRLHALLGQLGIDQEGKEDLVFNATGERTFRSSELLVHECNHLIRSLELRLKGHKFPVWGPDDSAQKQRRKLFSLAHEIRWIDNKGKVDRDRLYSWVEKYGYLHKPLMKYTDTELPLLVTQFEQVLIQFYATR